MQPATCCCRPLAAVVPWACRAVVPGLGSCQWQHTPTPAAASCCCSWHRPLPCAPRRTRSPGGGRQAGAGTCGMPRALLGFSVGGRPGSGIGIGGITPSLPGTGSPSYFPGLLPCYLLCGGGGGGAYGSGSTAAWWIPAGEACCCQLAVLPRKSAHVLSTASIEPAALANLSVRTLGPVPTSSVLRGTAQRGAAWRSVAQRGTPPPAMPQPCTGPLRPGPNEALGPYPVCRSCCCRHYCVLLWVRLLGQL